MKTTAIATLLMLMTTSALAEEHDSKPTSVDAPMVLSDTQMDRITAGGQSATYAMRLKTMETRTWQVWPKLEIHSTVSY